MLIPRFVVATVSLVLMVLFIGGVSGQNYPTRPIRMVVTEAGGIGDLAARIIGQGISGPLGQPVVIENRPSGLVGEIAARATPDGYTVLVSGSNLWLIPLLQKTTYDVTRDFLPISMATRSTYILAVHPSVAATSVKELIALAKAKPGVLNYGSPPIGSPPHIASELFKSMAGVNIVGIQYKGAAQAVTDLVGGQVQLMFAAPAASMPHIKVGRLRGLAISSAQPSALVPGLPTIAASGLPGFEAETTNGMFALAKTPAGIINRLNQEVVRVLNSAEVKEKLLNAGLEAAGGSPEEFAAKIRSEVVSVSKVIKEAGIKPES